MENSAVEHSFIEASKSIENGIICLLSALSYHEIGTQNPSEVWVALHGKMRPPQVAGLPIRISLFSGPAFEEGRTKVYIDEVEVHIYNIPKTIADCFKYRNKIGLEIALEALKDVLRHKKTTVDELLHYADICRVRAVMTPYMEIILPAVSRLTCCPAQPTTEQIIWTCRDLYSLTNQLRLCIILPLKG